MRSGPDVDSHALETGGLKRKINWISACSPAQAIAKTANLLQDAATVTLAATGALKAKNVPAAKKGPARTASVFIEEYIGLPRSAVA